MNKTITNEMIRKALRTRTVEAAEKILGQQDFIKIELDEEVGSSTQGFVQITIYDYTFVISKDYDGYVGLFNPVSFLANNEQIKKYDFLNKALTNSERAKTRKAYRSAMVPETRVQKYKYEKRELEFNKNMVDRYNKDVEELERKMAEAKERAQQYADKAIKQRAKLDAIMNGGEF